MRNKKAQAMFGIAIFVVLLLLAAGAGFVVWKTGVLSGTTQEVIQAQQLSATDCETAPSTSVNAKNALKQGTAVASLTVNYRVNGDYVGTTAPSSYQKGDEIGLLISKTNYVDIIVEDFKAACGNNIVAEDIFATSTNTFRIFNSDNNLLTDAAAGGATNQSTSASPISLEVKIDSTTDESTGDLIVVVEAENTTEVDTIKFSGSGVTDADIPQFYSPVAAGSISDAFRVPALLDGESKSYTLTLSPETGITIGAGTTAVYVTAYSEQAFVDVDGTYQVGVEDSDGTSKSEDNWDFDFMIA